MIFVDLDKVSPPQIWIDTARALTTTLENKPVSERKEFIESNRKKTWGADELVNALYAVVGRKCWYSEISLEGSDPNIDHFRPKGDVQEVDCTDNFRKTGQIVPGYWWWAFEPRNFRLSSMHSNQRRNNELTSGGKWNFFPVSGTRVPEKTLYLVATEDFLVLDPCSMSDVSLLWFDPDGKPRCSDYKRVKNDHDELRVRVTVWLFHLDKQEIEQKRASYMRDIRLDLAHADADYQIWNSDRTNLYVKRSFDLKISKIKEKLSDKAEFAGAKRCAVRAAISDFEWIEEFHILG